MKRICPLCDQPPIPDCAFANCKREFAASPTAAPVEGVLIDFDTWQQSSKALLKSVAEDGTPQADVEGVLRMALEASPNGYGCVKPDTDTQVFFYEQDFYVLSNFSAFKIIFKTEPYLGRWFDTSEQCYHWMKFDHLAGRGVQELIENANSAHEAFVLSQSHKELRRPHWDAEKVQMMKRILHAKAEQHEYVRRKLLATGDRELIEDSWRDDFWGWGPNRDGQNMLGKLWMEVRAAIRSLSPSTDPTPAESNHG